MWPDLLALIRFIIRFCTTLLFPFIHPNQFCTAVARNVRGTKQYALAAYQVARISRQRLTVAASFERQVARRPRALCLSFGAADQPELYSYHDVYSAAQRVANWLLQWPVSEGECVALLMSNRPEFMVTWLGAHYSGACAALLNTNLTPRALQHSVTSVGCCKLIAGEELRSVVEQAVGQGLLQGVCIRFVGRYMAPPPASPQSCSTCDAEIAACSAAAGELQLRRASLRSSSTLYYIFTSGTTGLPKAAAIPSSRFLAAGYGFSALASLRASDKIYCCLPIYHSSGGMLGFSMAWAVGASTHLSPKFSASRFWAECRGHKCSAIQYVGELLRYLTALPPSPDDRLHAVRLAVGNGLRPSVWADFNARFAVPQICEFYGSTEGNITLVNTMNVVGAVGYLPLPMRYGVWNSWLRLADTFAPYRIVRYDAVAEQPVLDARGRVTLCRDDEVGEILGCIDRRRPNQAFTGYTSADATQRKILRGAFRDGDEFFRSGDLVRMDSSGFVYFVDRIGDTFRWKGENVSTNEVADALSRCACVEEANVYGVQLPNCEGRIGMAAVVFGDAGPDWLQLAQHVKKELPSYAIPYFVRPMSAQDITGTFKHRKVELVKEGWSACGDAVFFYDAAACNYVPLDADLRRRIELSHIKI